MARRLHGTGPMHGARWALAHFLTSTLILSACEWGGGAELVSRATPEPPGANCPEGGTASASGNDDNGNGVLDDDEVDQVDYQCDVRGPLLSREEPASEAQCTDGGVVVHVGHDTDGDGVLDAGEVEGSTVACDAVEVWSGDLSIDVSDEMSRFHALRVVKGHLTLTGAGPAVLPALELVEGDLVAGGTHAQLRLPVLTSVLGNLDVVGARALEVPLLTHVGGDLLLSATEASELVAPELVSVDGTLSLRGSRLTSVRLPALVALGSLDVFNPAELATLELPALREIGRLSIFGAAQLPALELPALSVVRGDLMIRENPRLEQIHWPQLGRVDGNVVFFDWTALVSVALPALQVAPGNLMVWSGRLARLELGQLTHVAQNLTVAGGVEGSLQVLDLGALETAGPSVLRGFAMRRLELPALRRVDTLVLRDLAAVRAVLLPALTSAPHVEVLDAPVLRHLQLGVDLKSVENLIFVRVDLGPGSVLGLPRQVNRLAVLDTTQIEDLGLFAGLERIHALAVAGNPQLTSLAGLGKGTVIEDSLWISENPRLASLTGLELLGPLLGRLVINGNAKLVDVSALAGTTSVGGDFIVVANPALPGLDGLNVSSVGGKLWIYANDSLASLAGLAQLGHVGGQVHVEGAALLAEEIDALLAQLGL